MAWRQGWRGGRDGVEAGMAWLGFDESAVSLTDNTLINSSELGSQGGITL
jgi:hypothetical protein